MAQLIMASMAGLSGSSQAVLEGNLYSSSRLSIGNTAKIVVARPGFHVRAEQQISAKTETSRRALLGLGAAGVVSGSFVQAVLAEARTIEVGPPPSGGLLGGYEPIKDLKNPEVVNVAKFAVAEHNEEAGTSLVFASVDKGYTQVVAGINYKLVISAKDGGAAPQKYGVLVYSRPWEGLLKLVSFEKLLG